MTDYIVVVTTYGSIGQRLQTASWATMIVHSAIILMSVLAVSGSTSHQTVDFAESLLAEAEYYRAITEFKRAMFIDGGASDDTRARALLGIGTALYLAQDYDRGGEWFYQHIVELKRLGMYNRASSLMANSFLQGGAPQRLLEITNEGLLDDAEISYFRPLALSRMGNWSSAYQGFLAVDALNPYKATAISNSRIADEALTAPWKSPGLAASLGVIPGLGYMYAGHPQTGIASLIVNTVFGVATYQAFKADQDVLGAFLGLLSVSWYTSNVYGSAQAARRFNARLQSSYWSQIQY